MEGQIGELFIKIDYLEKMINTIQQNLNHNIQFIVAMITLTIAVLGGAVYFLVRMLVNERVDKELTKTIQDIPPIISFYKELNPDSGLLGYYSKYTIDVNLSKYKINNLRDLLCFTIFEKKYPSFNKLVDAEEKFNRDVQSINKNGYIKILDNYSLNIDFERQQIEIFIMTNELTIGDNSKKYCEFFIINPKYK